MEEIVRLVKKAIDEGNYKYIREAESIAYETGVEMSFDDEYVTVNDEVFYFNGAF